MPATLQHEGKAIYRLTISGLLRKGDLDRAQETLIAGMDHSPDGKARLLVVLSDFEGWDADSNWHDLTFYVRHGDRLDRIAIVGDERWRDHALMFAAADLRRGPVQFFGAGAIADARAWLSQ